MAKKTSKDKDDEDKKDINIFESSIVPAQVLLTEEEKQQLLQKLNISLRQLPRIKSKDPAAKVLGGKKGDVIKITRRSAVAGEYYYYRVVV